MKQVKEVISDVLIGHETLTAEVVRLKAALASTRSNLTKLLIESASRAKCKACDADIFFVRLTSGRFAPYDPDGVTHFATCPNAEQFRKRSKAND